MTQVTALFLWFFLGTRYRLDMRILPRKRYAIVRDERMSNGYLVATEIVAYRWTLGGATWTVNRKRAFGPAEAEYRVSRRA